MTTAFSAAACFNIRSVESCTAAIVTECTAFGKFAGFNIRSVESCTAAEKKRMPNYVYVSFQYSLCRIVYCCNQPFKATSDKKARFNIRSVESCTAAYVPAAFVLCRHKFQYSLCRIVYCCKTPPMIVGGIVAVSIFALSNRVLLRNAG